MEGFLSGRIFGAVVLELSFKGFGGNNGFREKSKEFWSWEQFRS